MKKKLTQLKNELVQNELKTSQVVIDAKIIAASQEIELNKERLRDITRAVRKYSKVIEVETQISNNLISVFDEYSKDSKFINSNPQLTSCLQDAISFIEDLNTCSVHLENKRQQILVTTFETYVTDGLKPIIEMKKRYERGAMEYDAALIKKANRKRELNPREREKEDQLLEEMHNLHIISERKTMKLLCEANAKSELLTISKIVDYWEELRNYFIRGLKISEKMQSKICKYRNYLKRSHSAFLNSKNFIESPKIFGCELVDLCKYENFKIPRFVKSCCEWIEKNGLECQGIFRISPSKDQMDELKMLIDQGERHTFEKVENPALVASALKLFLRDLKSPIIPYDINHFFDVDGLVDINQIRIFFQSLPVDNMPTFQYILYTLNKVASASNVNKMTADNLATVFAPNLVNNLDPLKMIRNTEITIKILSFMIKNYDSIFQNVDLNIDEPYYQDKSVYNPIQDQKGSVSVNEIKEDNYSNLENNTKSDGLGDGNISKETLAEIVNDGLTKKLSKDERRKVSETTQRPQVLQDLTNDEKNKLEDQLNLKKSISSTLGSLDENSSDTQFGIKTSELKGNFNTKKAGISRVVSSESLIKYLNRDSNGKAEKNVHGIKARSNSVCASFYNVSSIVDSNEKAPVSIIKTPDKKSLFGDAIITCKSASSVESSPESRVNSQENLSQKTITKYGTSTTSNHFQPVKFPSNLALRKANLENGQKISFYKKVPNLYSEACNQKSPTLSETSRDETQQNMEKSTIVNYNGRPMKKLKQVRFSELIPKNYDSMTERDTSGVSNDNKNNEMENSEFPDKDYNPGIMPTVPEETDGIDAELYRMLFNCEESAMSVVDKVLEPPDDVKNFSNALQNIFNSFFSTVALINSENFVFSSREINRVLIDLLLSVKNLVTEQAIIIDRPESINEFDLLLKEIQKIVKDFVYLIRDYLQYGDQQIRESIETKIVEFSKKLQEIYRLISDTCIDALKVKISKDITSEISTIIIIYKCLTKDHTSELGSMLSVFTERLQNILESITLMSGISDSFPKTYNYNENGLELKNVFSELLKACESPKKDFIRIKSLIQQLTVILNKMGDIESIKSRESQSIDTEKQLLKQMLYRWTNAIFKGTSQVIETKLVCLATKGTVQSIGRYIYEWITLDPSQINSLNNLTNLIRETDKYISAILHYYEDIFSLPTSVVHLLIAKFVLMRTCNLNLAEFDFKHSINSLIHYIYSLENAIFPPSYSLN